MTQGKWFGFAFGDWFGRIADAVATVLGSRAGRESQENERPDQVSISRMTADFAERVSSEMTQRIETAGAKRVANNGAYRTNKQTSSR